jgi:hypothetical protein
MATKAITTQTVPLGRIFLNTANPRHEPVSAEANTIEKLCSKENVQELARDIVRHGTNPLDLVGLVPIDARKTERGQPNFIVAEGNRRVCALKLLNDPDLAPANLRKAFETLSTKAQTITTVTAVVFPTMDDARLWMDRIHNGFQGGIGRRSWTADQKARNDGGNKNKLAQLVLDYAEQHRMLNAGERTRRLTTAQRFLNNDVLQETVGIDQSDPDVLNRTRPKEEFDIMLEDLLEIWLRVSK